VGYGFVLIRRGVSFGTEAVKQLFNIFAPKGRSTQRLWETSRLCLYRQSHKNFQEFKEQTERKSAITVFMSKFSEMCLWCACLLWKKLTKTVTLDRNWNFNTQAMHVFWQLSDVGLWIKRSSWGSPLFDQSVFSAFFHTQASTQNASLLMYGQ